jgi:Predicted dehydrogenases and related proteins
MSPTTLYEPLTAVASPATHLLGLGIIGFGNIGRQHYSVALANPDLEVKSVADPHLPQEGLSPFTTAFHDWEELLHDPKIDAVSICVPHHLHYPITMAALEAGKHVLVEKPLGLTVSEGHELIEYARLRQRIMMVELTHRFYPSIREAQRFVQAGHLGEIFAVEDKIVESVGAQITPWLQDKKLAGGGVALTNGIHMLDRIAALTGQKLVFLSGTAGYSGRLGDIEDTAAMLLRLESGPPVQVLASWSRGNKTTDDELTIYGSQGTLRIWAWRGWRFEPSNGGPAKDRLCFEPSTSPDARIQAGVSGALQEFVSAIKEKRPPSPSGHDALAAQKLIEQFYAYIA